MSTEEAEALLLPSKKGTWLVRMSSVAGAYIVSVRDSKQTKVNHFDITQKRAGANVQYLWKDKAFSSLDQLLSSAKKEFHLKDVCPGSKYAKI